MAWLLKRDGSALPIGQASAVELILDGNAEFDRSIDWTNLTAVAINLPKFSDGRGYSLARLIAQRSGFQGELRAQGDVLVDQVFLLARVGFTSFALREDQSLEAAQKALNAFNQTYVQATWRPDLAARQAA